MDTIRYPVIPIDYENRYKAVKKELVQRYNSTTKTVDLFIVSPEDPSLLIDVTANIREKIDNLSADTIIVTLEGVGDISVQDLLTQMRTTINNAVQCIDMSEDVSYVTAITDLDNISISINTDLKKVIEIKGFNVADDNTIPVKRNGIIKWIPMISNTTEDPISDVTTDPPSNPDDGLGEKCSIIDPVDHRLYLRASRSQKSIFINGDQTIVLPTPLDEKSDIEWMLTTNNEVPVLIFPTNIIWKESPTALSINSIYVFIFKTWNDGITWVGEYTLYNKQ